jgi:uncharacterized protein YggE
MMSNMWNSLRTTLAVVALWLLVAVPTLVEAQAVRGPAEPAFRVEIAVERTAGSATGALASADLDAQRVAHALRRSGVRISSIQMLPAVVTAEYEAPGVVAVTTIRDDRRLVGYRAVIGLVVDLADADRAGLAIDLAHGAGASRITGVVGGVR